MCLELRGEGGCFRFEWMGWEEILQFARQYGWKPAGTKRYTYPDEEPHEISDWSGTYLSSNAQFASAEDAANLAEALERVLVDIPNHAVIDWRNRNWRKHVRGFLRSCRAGGFCIC